MPAVTPERVAAWLGADRLVFGDISEFNDVNVGVYKKRVVAGTLRLWEKASKSDVWSREEKVTNSSLAIRGKDVAASFLGGLASSWFDRLKKKPLGAEVEEFVRRELERLPMRPTQ